ncbi:hypothetical protein BDV10DRAFT_185404 [Aspergillus recurvatus]
MPVPKDGGNICPQFHVARLLDQAGVPNVLWGWLALALVASDHGNRGVEFAEFVILDDKLDAGFTPCTSTECPELCGDQFPPEIWYNTFQYMGSGQRAAVMGAGMSFDRYHPVAAVHYQVVQQSDEYRILSLHKESSQLWWLPELKITLPKWTTAI